MNKILTSGFLFITILLLGGFSVDKMSNRFELEDNSFLSIDTIWDPPAIKFNVRIEDIFNDSLSLDSLITLGSKIFEAKFNQKDGAGRPSSTGDSKPTPRNKNYDIGLTRISGPDATSCLSCHNQPKSGGSGDFVANVFVGAHFLSKPTKSIDSKLTNERNTIGIFGSGVVEALSKEITTDLHAIRDKALLESKTKQKIIHANLTSKGISFGEISTSPNGQIDFSKIEGIDFDLVVRPFGVKGIAASIREFTIAALNQHHGIQAIERFGWERTGIEDFDSDGVINEMSIGNLTALVLFQATLPIPVQKKRLNEDEYEGRQVFEKLKCGTCHRPLLPLNNSDIYFPNRFNRPGNLLPSHLSDSIRVSIMQNKEVNVYSDFKRHNLCDDEINYFCNETIKQDNVDTDLFLTSKLWDLATSAPYGHRGDLMTISEAILAHGGEARQHREEFIELSDNEKEYLILFLLTLGSES